jgi:hypothetical protein
MAINEVFRICPSTGLKIHKPAENLIKANAVAAVVFLAIGGLFGLMVALTRWPAVHLLPADWFYLALTAHGLDVLLVWIIFFEMAVLYFASAILLNSRLASPRWAWVGFWMMLVGALVVNAAVLAGNSSVMFTSYVPMQASPWFYLGFLVFAVGALIGCFVFFGTLQDGVVGDGPFVPADQRLGARRGVVRDRRHRAGCETPVREGQPYGVSPVHPVPATRECPPSAGGAGHQLHVENLQHELCHLSRGTRQHGPRHDRARIHRGRPARKGSHQRGLRMASQGSLG